MVKAIDSDWSDTWGVSDYSQANLSKFDGTNLDVSNVTDMRYMFYGNHHQNIVVDFDPENPSLLGFENAGRVSTSQLIDGELFSILFSFGIFNRT